MKTPYLGKLGGIVLTIDPIEWAVSPVPCGASWIRQINRTAVCPYRWKCNLEWQMKMWQLGCQDDGAVGEKRVCDSSMIFYLMQLYLTKPTCHTYQEQR